MEDTNQNQPAQKRELRGLYKHVKIPVPVLDAIIIGCILVIIVFLAIDLQNPGFTISFDSKGGTDVAAQKQEYGELLVLPEPPTREGYQFTGWYTDYGCTIAWNAAQQTVQSDMTLYAGWQTLP